jgi:hypothetical protein
LQFQVANLTAYIQYHQDLIDMLMSTVQDHATRITTLESEISNSTNGLGGTLNDNLVSIVDAINAIPSTAVNATLAYI